MLSYPSPFEKYDALDDKCRSVYSSTYQLDGLMSLADFIRSNIETILQNWEQFARDIPSGKRMDKLELRDHAIGILRTIADELELAATGCEKLKMQVEDSIDTTEAMLHGITRIFQGFSVSDTLSEFRALRASVLQLWTKHNEKLLSDIQPSADEIMQFNSAIDQALTESVLQFSKEAERTTQLFDALYASSPDLNYMFDLEGKLIFANRAFIDLVGLELDEIIGKNFINFNTSDSVEINQHLMESIDTKKITRGEMRWCDAGNKETIYEYFFVPVLADEQIVKVITGTARDITERKALQEKNHKRANYDSLTGLPNRDLFTDRLNLEIKRVERTGLPLALLFIDLDKFKEANDLFGHGVGDILLVEVAARISACVRGTDTVARLSGDEFTVILTEVNRIPHVEIIAQEIVQSLAKPFLIKNERILISGSVGITLCPQDGSTANVLLKNADQAMYVVKHSGGNQFNFFMSSMRDAAWARLKVIGQLQNALILKQMHLQFQPIINLQNGEIVKAEALLRWQLPESGIIMPLDFISVAEEIGLIAEIDEWVFIEALNCAKKWSAMLGTPFQVTVNKSAGEFSQRATFKDWLVQLSRLNLSESRIAIEITEDIFLQDVSKISDRLLELQAAGIEIIIDNFGKGHSLMAFLKKIEAKYLKIDQTFIHDILSNEGNLVMAETIIHMSHKMGMQTIANGVENSDQHAWLLQAGCDYGQGFYYSPAVDFEQFSLLLKDRNHSWSTV